MADLISRAAAIDRIDKCVALSGIGCEPVMAIRDIKALISVLPTIDAIPVKWLREWQDEVGTMNEWWPIIERIITVWQEEQGAR